MYQLQLRRAEVKALVPGNKDMMDKEFNLKAGSFLKASSAALLLPSRVCKTLDVKAVPNEIKEG